MMTKEQVDRETAEKSERRNKELALLNNVDSMPVLNRARKSIAQIEQLFVRTPGLKLANVEGRIAAIRELVARVEEPIQTVDGRVTAVAALDAHLDGVDVWLSQEPSKISNTSFATGHAGKF